MYTGSPIFVRVRNSRWIQPVAGASWLLMAPGLMLIGLALAILIWPELLAYLVAGAILLAGIALTGWGWGLHQAARRASRNGTVTYWPE
ncbi:MAG TPA: hypothetical protein VNK95_07380 [Caldilineaceae bacterium]|nr:hypothetical protein [Caldilineaceae bacterium]